MASRYTTAGEYLRPARIHVDRAAGRLAIAWVDGHESEYDSVSLRWLCPCAYCRGEAGSPGWLDSAPILTPAQVQIVDVRLVGTYALEPTWGDGHHAGYFTWDQLRASCSCPEDAMLRATSGGGATESRDDSRDDGTLTGRPM
jgi:DUF971 family protein